ncbi:transport protein particle bet3 containing protein, partial [Nannochloropsis gaditana CCMP526]
YRIQITKMAADLLKKPSSTSSQHQNKKVECADSLFDYLFAAMIDTLRTGGDQGPRKEELLAETVRAIGFDVGYRLAESIAQGRVLAAESLEVNVMKFICKEFWIEIFKKQIDKLQTNNQGVFVLRDAKFRWLAPFTANDESTRRAAATVLNFPCGLIKGALENLGINSTVQAEVAPAVPSCSFTIKIRRSGSGSSSSASLSAR